VLAVVEPDALFGRDAREADLLRGVVDVVDGQEFVLRPRGGRAEEQQYEQE
jgi:hypothetical protein